MSGGTAIAFDAALARVPADGTERYARLFEHGSLSLGLYAPRGADAQQPHARDEVYVVVQGRGFFVCGEERCAFAPGAALFVPAGVEHRFEAFSDDLAVWVVFYGPPGGEAKRADGSTTPSLSA